MIDYTCRVCRQPKQIKEPPGYIPEIHGKWVKMLTCNPCYDIYETCRNQEEAIRAAACLLSQIRTDAASRKNTKEEQADRERRFAKIKIRVAEHAARWARNEAKRFGAAIQPDTEEVVDSIMDNPDKYGIILKEYRDIIRDRCQPRQSVLV